MEYVILMMYLFDKRDNQSNSYPNKIKYMFSIALSNCLKKINFFFKLFCSMTK